MVFCISFRYTAQWLDNHVLSKKLLHIKGNYQQNEKTSYWMGEDIIFANDTSDKGLIPKIYKEFREH